MSNHFGSLAWAAACPRSSALLPRDLAPGYAPLGRVRPSGVETPVEQHAFATFTAVQANAQVKDSGIRMSWAPPPWRPPE